MAGKLYNREDVLEFILADSGDEISDIVKTNQLLMFKMIWSNYNSAWYEELVSDADVNQLLMFKMIWWNYNSAW